jgi:hypothetical protein
MFKFFNSLRQRFQQDIVKPIIRHLATPVGKITLLNSILFVYCEQHRAYGKSTVFHKVFFKNILPFPERT